MAGARVNLDLERGSVGWGLRKIGQWVKLSEFTDGAGVAGTLDLAKQIPAGSIVLATKVKVTEGFVGDTTAKMIIGLDADTDRYSLSDHDVLAAGSNKLSAADGAEGGVYAPALITADTTVLVTVTGGSDFGAITAGKAYIEVLYFSTNPEIEDQVQTRYDGGSLGN